MSAPRSSPIIVDKLDFDQRPFRITTDSGDVYLADA
jgi:hypothetical protein